MNDTQRTLLTFSLVALLTLAIPFYLQFIGVAPGGQEGEALSPQKNKISETTKTSLQEDKKTPLLDFQPTQPESSSTEFVVQTDLFRAQVSSLSGGSLASFSITDSNKKSYQYLGGYNDFNEYQDSISVNLLKKEGASCSPCLNLNKEGFSKYNVPFSILSPKISDNQVFNLSKEDSLVVVMNLFLDNAVVKKTTVFYGNSYVVDHRWNTQNVDNANVSWGAGIRPTEKNLSEEITFSSAYIAQDKNIESVALTPSSLSDSVERLSMFGPTDWVAVRNKYFISSLISNDANGGFVSGKAAFFQEGVFVPQYTMGLNFNKSSFSVRQFFGPLDVDIIEESGTYLDRVMNFGWLPIQPFSRAVLWILKTLYLTGLNYGVILILFAFLIRVVTGPLTKKSFESSQKMQELQPKLKKIQEKYKNDSARLNQKMVEFYKKEGYNPLGGCLPMIIQMPLLFSLFIVFRSTIEFRGAPFFGWINNLSQPDIIFNLGFSVPLYGSHVSFLPVVLGVSMFMSQKLSMANMDPKQKPMMYIMSAFFFLLFNSFPSGLNLYYAMYNILNYFQQRGLKKA
jgi:YidC/Oxa1 family membrane protein insertase